MPRSSASVSRRERNQPLGKIEALCCKYLDPRQLLTVGVPELLVLESALLEISQAAAISDRALSGLLGIYALSIRRSCPLLEPCSSAEAQQHASVRGALSKQLSNVADPHRARQIALSILRGQILRCYAVLLADAASSLMRQPSKRNKDKADALLCEVYSLTRLVDGAGESESDTRSLPSELLRTLQAEVLASSVLEHWACLLLTLACEGSERAQSIAAVHLKRFSSAPPATLKGIDPDFVQRLLASSPCLSYLLASQLVTLCAVLDGGTVYGMPEVPGGVLAASVLALRPEGRERDSSAIASLEAAVGLAGITLAALPPLPGCRILQDAEPACASQPTGAGDDAALAARVVPLAVPETAAASSAGGTTAAESHTRDSGATPSAPAGAASVSSEAAQAGRTAASQQPYATMGRTTVPPTLLLNPAVRFEVSLRLVMALCRALAPTQFDAQDGIEEGRCPEAGQPPWLHQLREASSSLPLLAGLKGAFNALRSAGQVLSDSPPCFPAVEDGHKDSAAAARESVALSPLERWWGGAVALGRAVADVAAAAAEVRVESERAQEFAVVVDKYFVMMEELMKSQEEGREPLPQLSSYMTAALNAGLLPCLERLLRAVLPLPLASGWALHFGPTWNFAWAQMLAFADAGEVAAVVDAAAEGLRRAVAACSAASQCQGGSTVGTARSASADSRCVLRLGNAALLACHLTGTAALVRLTVLARKLASEPRSPDGDAVARTVAARLGGSLSHIATRLLPEISRALLGGLLPLFRHGIIIIMQDWMCALLKQQLQWVQVLAAALAGSAPPAAAAAAADGSTDGGGCSSAGGGSPCAARWRQLLFVELRLPSLLGAALELSLSGGTAEESNNLVKMRKGLRIALRALAALVPADLARMVAAADRAEAAAACRTVASRGPVGAAAAPPSPSPPSSGLLRRALGPGGSLEDAEVLAAVEAACAGRVGAGAGMEGGKDEFLVALEALSLGARLLFLHG